MTTAAPPSPVQPWPARHRLRIALYSHDTLGLGHIRRNLAIAGALARRSPGPDLLLVSGTPLARVFALPPGTDCLTLPGLAKNADGDYGARSLSTTLDELVELRARTIDTTLDVFDPDVLVVDKVAAGAFRELLPALGRLQQRGRTRVVLGLRDVLDRAEVIRQEWHDDDTVATLRRFYDAIWVYGDPAVADPVRECGLPRDLAAMVRYTGYLAPVRGGQEDAADPPALPGGPYVLCCLGGGLDGARLAESFLDAGPPPGHTAVLVCGPYLPEAVRGALVERYAARPDRLVLGTVADCRPLLDRAAAVVAMGGYNTTVELLAARVPALIVPRVAPRAEQLLRAERLAGLGLIEVRDPRALDARWLRGWLDRAVLSGRPRGRRPIDLAGLDRLGALLDELVSPAERTMCRAVS